ncbi:DUF6221 family protein [Streptomyces tauricus]|uniref:DUF6221 family protein n=1 Tax=Streptomyces tauricus TaxID=68274 RepID=UPI003417B348
MDDLVRWLGMQLDEDERIARAATPGPWHAQDGGVISDDDDQWPVASAESRRDRADRVHVATWDPARVLREIEAKRSIIEQHERYAAERRRMMGGWDPQSDDSPILAALAAVYADRPGYLESWRP